MFDKKEKNNILKKIKLKKFFILFGEIHISYILF